MNASIFYPIGLLVVWYVAHRWWIGEFPDTKYSAVDIIWSFLVAAIWPLSGTVFVIRFIFKHLDDKLESRS